MSFEELRNEVCQPRSAETVDIRERLYLRGFNKNRSQSNVLRRADAISELFICHKKHVYKNDLILGSIRGKYGDSFDLPADCEYAGLRHFGNGFDHYASNYQEFLARGIDGNVSIIHSSMKKFEGHKDRIDFLTAAERTMNAMSTVFEQYADEAERMGLQRQAEDCRYVAHNAPKTFRQALQLVFITHILFHYERRYAMAFGRLDQYLYPFYTNDINNGTLTPEDAEEIIASALYKIHELTVLDGYDDVCNIAIGGVKPCDGSDATNELSYLILNAVNKCHVPGPNLSARINKGTPQKFIDECLKVIGTGLGYPALMNDDANIPALYRYGIYSLEDCRNYCMVGCIENFIQGNQPPWSDGRYNSPKYLEYALTNGKCMLKGNVEGLQTGEAEDFNTMDEFVDAVEKQMRYGAKIYVDGIHRSYNIKADDYQQPFLSCFCNCCLERGLDINLGGAKYPSAHGACCMGVATIADSLAAIEKLVFIEKKMTLAHMRDVLMANFEGYDEEYRLMLDCPKYGNNDDFVDKWAVWFVDKHVEIFDEYRTSDGGPVYIAIASNTANIYAGACIGASPDGRKARAEVSDAASPMHGMDKNGPTATFLSLSKPDYTKSATGTVINQKYPPSMFTEDDKRQKLGALIRVYFNRGGQEVQINSVSRDVLKDAMDNPSKYGSLVVRVSGFSAYYTRLDRSVQEDILKRTEHTSI
ncbi:MAG: hypothetical protein J6L92_01325 [Clostridia bacterium]|nr:hypothetical protein [Clostridia bacterium]